MVELLLRGARSRRAPRPREAFCAGGIRNGGCGETGRRGDVVGCRVLRVMPRRQGGEVFRVARGRDGRGCMHIVFRGVSDSVLVLDWFR